MTLQERICVCFVLLLIIGGVWAVIIRHIFRQAFREECREKARTRLTKVTGWEPLDDINMKLLDAYLRRYSCE